MQSKASSNIVHNAGLSLRGRFWRFVLRKVIKGRRLVIEERRTGVVVASRFIKLASKSVSQEKIYIDDLPATWVSAKNADKNKVVLYLHGGGYVAGLNNSYLMMCLQMAQILRTKVLLPEYRLAPKHPFPAALQDAQKAYLWLLAQGYEPCNIIFLGDSAGGGLSVATVLSLRDAGLPLPAAVVCISPWVDLTLMSQSHITNSKAEVLLETEILREWAGLYGGGADLHNPLISPVYADFNGFPALMIQVGSDEILLDDARMFAEKARAGGAIVEFSIWEGLWHVWHVLGSLIPESGQAFEEIGRFVSVH